MTVGVAAAHADEHLNLYRGTNATGFTPFIQLHVGDPGAAGTANIAASSTRVAATFAAPTGARSIDLSAAVPFTGTATETITHISIWTAITAGTFKRSVILTAQKAIEAGDTLNLTTLTISFAPISA